MCPLEACAESPGNRTSAGADSCPYEDPGFHQWLPTSKQCNLHANGAARGVPQPFASWAIDWLSGSPYLDHRTASASSQTLSCADSVFDTPSVKFSCWSTVFADPDNASSLKPLLRPDSHPIHPHDSCASSMVDSRMGLELGRCEACW